MSLQKIQARLVAPKGQTNKFGGYQYRSCEDILSAVKPLLDEFGYHLIINDEIVEIGGRVYVKAHSFLVDTATLETVAETSAFAREPMSKKGMDESQITGTASSYARKYSLNGMFAIDDTKDADSNEQANDLAKPRVAHEKQLEANKKAMRSAANIGMLKTLARSATDYFDQWGRKDLSAQIASEYKELSVKLEKEAA